LRRRKLHPGARPYPLPYPTSRARTGARAQFYELAHKEIGALILSDEHPNIVRCFAMEEDAEFVYLALERCRQSLHDLMAAPDAGRQFVDEQRRPTPFCMQARAAPQSMSASSASLLLVRIYGQLCV